MAFHNKEIWEKICRVFLATKELTIKIEEINDEHKAFLQPVNELKSALDHIIRVQAAELNLCEIVESSQYIKSNLDKTLGHMYRAFFDAADYFSLILREKILKVLQKYSSDTIHKVITDYYSHKKVFIENLNDEIVVIRLNKDIGNEANILPSIDEYSLKLKDLYAIYRDIEIKIPQLDELYTIEKRKKSGRTRLAIAGIIFGIIGLIGTIFTILSFLKML